MTTAATPHGVLDEIPTIHEGVAAQALERKGIISDRCELNRQIKADNALLRELKAEIKKLAALVARTVPAIAEGLEKLRSRVLIFCYQLSHIRSGKSHIQKSLAVWKPELERYTGLVQQIKAKEQGAQNTGCREKGIANIPCKTPQGAGCPHCRADGRFRGTAFRKGTSFAKI